MRLFLTALASTLLLAHADARAEALIIATRPEPVFRSGVEQSTCVNGVIEDSEQCDDNNAVNGDGCPTNCRLIQCGDGAQEPAEECDDGSLDPADGCGGDLCEITPGWVCGPGVVGVPSSTSVCVTVCGDTIVAGDEQCDVGDTENGDGCNSLCRIEVAPVAGDDSLITNEDTVVMVSAATLRSNDIDVNGDALTVLSVQAAANGSVFLSGGSVSFVPQSNFFGEASFQYTLSDGWLTDAGLVTVNVGAVNDAPIANPSSTVLDESAIGHIVNLSGSDIDSPTLTFAIDQVPLHGVLGAITPNGSFSATVGYTPTANYAGSDSFTFHASDSALDSTPATVSITINNLAFCSNGVIEPPEACDDQNLEINDGCSDVCEVEAGYDCSGEPSTCVSDPTSIASVDYSVIAHGGRVRVTGTGFVGATAVTIGGVNQAFGVVSNVQISVGPISDTMPVGTHNLVVTGPGGVTSSIALTVIHLVINESDSDTPGSDTAEFVEIATGVPGVNLNGYTLVFWNGANDLSYFALGLNATTDANGLLLVGDAGVTPTPALVFGNNVMQNGQDAVSIFQASAATFPNGSALTAVALIDALVYDTNDPDDIDLLNRLMLVQVQVDEGSAPIPAENRSIQRCGSARRNGLEFGVAAPTPGAASSFAACL